VKNDEVSSKKKKSSSTDTSKKASDWLKAEKQKLKEAQAQSNSISASNTDPNSKKKKKGESSATAKAQEKPKESVKSEKSVKSTAQKSGNPKQNEPLAPRKQSKSAQKSSKQVVDSNDYMSAFGLPSSSSESESEIAMNSHLNAVENETQDSKAKGNASRGRIDDKDARKKAMREAEAVARTELARKQALEQDDFVFDVSFAADKTLVSSENARDIKVSDMTLRVAGKVLLENTQLTIAFGRRYALIGPNGKGKTSLMKMLGQRKIPVPENIDVLLVEQEMEGTERTALRAVVEADAELNKLRKLQEELESLNMDSEDDSRADELNEVYERLKELDSASAEPRAAKILSGLGFNTEMQYRKTNQFSGGWRMRISLARALFMEPTLLLLDEPTNHLDLRAVLWLEEYLKRWKKTLIVVSHDRDFLNSVVTDVIHLHDRKLDFYKGDFEQFHSMMEQRRLVANKAAEKFEKSIKAAKGDKTKKEKAFAAAKLAAKKSGNADGQSSASTVESNAVIPTRWADYSVKFEFPEPTELPHPLLQLIDVEFEYPSRADFKMERLNLGVDMGTRVAVVGANGSGKSTLMNLLAGDLIPTAGEARRSHKLRIGRYSQHFVDVLQMDLNPVEYLLQSFPESGLNGQNMRAKLGRFGLPGANHLQPIIKLSGGQKARVVFTAISLAQPHILLLDEPTNHLDMESIDALAAALVEYEGGVVLISHDSRIISQVCEDETTSEVWVVEDGTVNRFNGSFEDFKEQLIAEVIAEQEQD